MTVDDPIPPGGLPAPPPHPPPPAADSAAPRILVVDDEPSIVEMLVRYLVHRGFGVIGADGPEAAKRLVTRDPGIAVVLSDVRMPGQTGLALAEELRRIRSEAEALEVVLLTGGATTDVALGALRARTFDLVQKPIRLSEVGTVVERALASSLQRRARAARDAEVQAGMDQAEAERRRLSERLATSTARLDDARSALAASESVRGDLLAVLSHELRTPLIPIVGFAEILASGTALPREEVQDYGRLIQDGARRLMTLVEGALDIVALNHGRALDIGLAEPLGRLVARLTAAFAATAAEHGVTLRETGPADTMIGGDLRRLSAALGQLLDNAIKASPRGGTVELGWEPTGTGVAILLRDRGAGLPAGLLERIGTPFLQADMSLSRTWPGAGLGLALAKRVAEAHGGALRLLPRQGGGTEARLEIPAVPPAR